MSHPGTTGTWPTVTGSRNALDAATPYDAKQILQPTSIRIHVKENDLVSIAIKGMPNVWCAWLSDKDGKRVVPIDVGMSPASISPGKAALTADGPLVVDHHLFVEAVEQAKANVRHMSPS